MEFSLRFTVLKKNTMKVKKGNQLKIRLLLLLVRIWMFLGEIQLSLGHINSRFTNMDEHLDSLGAQVAAIDRKMSLGASVERLHGDPAQSRSSEATQSPSHA